MTARRFAIATVLLVALAGCGGKQGGTASASPTAPTGVPSTPVTSSALPSPTSTGIDQAVLTELSGVLQKSVDSMKVDGLTESWSDSDGAPTLVVVWDVQNAQSVTLDLDLQETEVGDFEYMTPVIAQEDLATLKAGKYSNGIVSKDSAGHYYVEFTLDGEKYASTYSVDSQGRLSSSTTYVGTDLLGIVNMSYSVTADGQKALDAAAKAK